MPKQNIDTATTCPRASHTLACNVEEQDSRHHAIPTNKTYNAMQSPGARHTSRIRTMAKRRCSSTIFPSKLFRNKNPRRGLIRPRYDAPGVCAGGAWGLTYPYRLGRGVSGWYVAAVVGFRRKPSSTFWGALSWNRRLRDGTCAYLRMAKQVSLQRPVVLLGRCVVQRCALPCCDWRDSAAMNIYRWLAYMQILAAAGRIV